MKHLLNNLEKENLVHIATIEGCSGSMGILNIKFVSPEFDIDTEEPIFLEFDGYMVPFFIVEDSYKNLGSKGETICLDTINSKEKAFELIGKEIYVSQENFITIEDEDSQEEEFPFIGYRAIDNNNQELGTIVDVELIPSNPLILLDNDLMLPVNAVEIIKQDDENKILTFVLPDGLVEALLG